MSQYTSFLVVEHRTGARRASGQPETRVIPVNLPAGWAMFAATQVPQGLVFPSVMASMSLEEPSVMASMSVEEPEVQAHAQEPGSPVVRRPTATRRTAKLPIFGSDRAERDLAWRPESDSERAAV